MKSLVIIVASVLFSIGYSASAQTQSVIKPNNTQPQTGVTKGYYTIGNNAERLAPGITLAVQPAHSQAYPAVQKGYYTIGNNNQKLPKPLVIQVSPNRPKPVAAKGYYSIGKNEKQQEQ